MPPPVSYLPSRVLPGETELLRQHSFTRWLSRDLLNAAFDFCKHLGQIAIYIEHSPDHLTRCLFWRPPQGTGFEIRSARREEEFRRLDQKNADRNWRLLTLHINESDVHSAVWISPDHYQTAVAVLAVYGVTPAERKTPE